jgi:excisionase family DNA binding protein
MSDLLTVPEVARRLRIGRTLAYMMVRRGELPAVRFGKLVRVPADRLDEWLARRIEGGTRPNSHCELGRVRVDAGQSN